MGTPISDTFANYFDLIELFFWKLTHDYIGFITWGEAFATLAAGFFLFLLLGILLIALDT